ncbi:MAG: hypothetical protein IJJ28_01940 [Lentisphaeria bacterium]|nr:hypothetical protein [Lentisphaeria bacterium]
MIEQPDFGNGFHRTDDRPLRYMLRSGENRMHDLFYLASFIHEAHFRVRDIAAADGRFSLRMTRVRWELLRHRNDLSDIASTLTVSHVRHFRLHSGWPFPSRRELEIRDLCLFDGVLHLRTTFDFLELTITLSSNSRVVLCDSPPSGGASSVPRHS